MRKLIAKASAERVERPKLVPRVRITKLSKALKAEILERYKNGERPVDIARHFGISEWRVQDLRKRSDVPKQDRSMSEAETKRARRLHNEGLSLNKIGAALGRDPKTVKKALTLRKS